MKWTWSAYEEYGTCPKQFHERRILKNFSGQGENQSAEEGRVTHKALEDAVQSPSGSYIPPEFKKLETLIEALRNAAGEKHCEYKLALTSALKPCDFWDEQYWVRVVIDYLCINGDKAMMLDYKTGKRKLTRQNILSAIHVFIHHPEVKVIQGGFLWLKENGKIDREEYHKKDLIPMFKLFTGRLGEMKQSERLDIWPAKRNGLCQNWCPVKTCCYNGGFKP